VEASVKIPVRITKPKFDHSEEKTTQDLKDGSRSYSSLPAVKGKERIEESTVNYRPIFFRGQGYSMMLRNVRLTDERSPLISPHFGQSLEVNSVRGSPRTTIV